MFDFRVRSLHPCISLKCSLERYWITKFWTRSGSKNDATEPNADATVKGLVKIGWTLMIIIEKIYIYMIGQFWWLLRFLLISTIGFYSRDQVICYSGGTGVTEFQKESKVVSHFLALGTGFGPIRVSAGLFWVCWSGSISGVEDSFLQYWESTNVLGVWVSTRR